MARRISKRRTADPVVASPVAPPAAWIRHWSWIYLLGASLAMALVAFAPALQGTFIFDDYHLPFADPHAAELPVSAWVGGVRPVLIATYWLNYVIAGTRPLAYHVTNVLIHAGTAVMMFFIYDRLLEISRGFGAAATSRRWYALFGAALFLVHPLQTESVDYIAGRSELISGFFFFAAWLVYLRGFENDTGFVQTLKIAVLAGLGVLSKESAISLPALLLLTDFYFSGQPIGKQLARRFKLYAVFLVGGAAGVAVILRSLTHATSAGFSAGISPFSYALTECRAILTYLRLFVLPFGQNGDWKLPLYHSLAEGAAAVYTLALLLAIALVFLLYKRARLISFGLAVFLLTLMPTSSFVPISDTLAERRMYLPIAGLIFLLMGAALKIPFTPAWRRAVAVMTLLVFATLSWSRSVVWASDLNLWTDATRGNPANSRAHFGLGSALLLRRDCAGAAREFTTALSQDKSDQKALWNLGEADQCGGKTAEALTVFRSYAAVRPTATAYEKIGYNEATLGHADEAVKAFERAIELDPNDASAYAYRGIARLALNDREGAQADVHHALQLDPGNQIAAVSMEKLAAEP